MTEKQPVPREDITKQFRAQNQRLWVQRTNYIRTRATEIVNNDLI